MIEQKVKVTTNIEAKSAALFVQTANKFTSNIKVKIDNRIVNAKSIMGMISLGILRGQDVVIMADGYDETNVVGELKKVLQWYFKKVRK